MAKLVLRRDDGGATEYEIDKDRLTIGRRSDNDVCLTNSAVSAEHAVVVTILNDSFLEDLGSTNGTFVNGKPVKRHFLTQIEGKRTPTVNGKQLETQTYPLYSNDIIELGGVKLQFLNVSPS